MRKIKRPIEEHHAYFISTSTYNREKLFHTKKLTLILRNQIEFYHQYYGFDLYAYVIMPNHYHLLLKPTVEKNISKILHGINSSTANLINQKIYKGQNMRKVWMGSPWDYVIRNEKMFLQKFVYIFLNPWRKKLIKNMFDNYQFSTNQYWIDKYGEEGMLELIAEYKRHYE